MTKVPEFVPGLYFSLVKKDPKDLMKELYEEYHEIVSTFLVKYYDNYSKSFSTNDRGMYKYIIENTLKFYIENDAFPTTDSINELKIQWFKRNTSDYAKISDTAKSKEMLTYKERRKLLEQAFAVVAERHNITNYTIIDSYELNDNMNAIVEKFRNNDKHLDDAVLPYIRSSV
jgi:NAD+--asparagine ADP-ribosyltransferase